MCELCNGFCANRWDDKLGYLDCCLFVKERKRNKIMRWVLKYIFRNRYLMVLMLFGCEDVSSNGNKPTDNGDQLSFNISMLNERGYPMSVDGKVYSITISPNHQSIFKMQGITGSSRTERITWTNNKSYSWSNGLVTDVYWLLNPTSYTKDSVGYSMVGFMPGMIGSSVIIYGHYYSLTDSIVVNIH
jgi:hypothetical protein